MHDTDTIEETLKFSPKFNENGLIPCVTVDHNSGQILMLAYMNKESISLSLETKEAHYWSRSRQEIWHKGATSGNIQKIVSMKIDCDQDSIIIEVTMPESNEGLIESCHTGRETCFYREVILDNNLIVLKK